MPTDMEKTLAERRSRYGNFEGHAQIAQSLKAAMKKDTNWETLPPYMKEALEMVQHKVARILNGDPFYDDSWRDMVGYSGLVLRRLEKPAKKGKK